MLLFMQQYGDKIRAHRASLGLSQRAYALRIGGGTDGNTVSRWENNKMIPSPATLERLRQDGADLPPRIQPRTLAQRVAALEATVDELMASGIPAAKSGAGGSGPRSRALPASADLDAAKAPHEFDPLNPQERSTRRRRGTQADALGT